MDGNIVKKISAKDLPYKKIITIFLILMAIFICAANSIFILINHLIFLAQNLVKLYLLLKIYLCKYKGISATNAIIMKLKKYSILIPLYKEKDGVKHITKAIRNLRYPRDLLEVRLIIEEDDTDTLETAQNADLPHYFKIIKVPFSIPRTKPKALNYAMDYVTGEYVVVYDAEDKPEREQLLKTSRIFANSDANMICLQARLSFENKGQNLLTRFFEMEYRIWFDFLLPGIDKINMPIPLGGSSNHFKAKELRQIGLWDPYNVTEDADLGIRIYQNNFKTKIID
jgi:cellulose synthase/poly-beta-1,6-N-acetylglucosamine synthase-like glycosyltransferase